jgi:tRNA dimethylallyltransferase
MSPRDDAGAVRALAIVGPTAAGKSETALMLAETLDGEIVSADSRQVYRHLDIGTAKPSAAEQARVAHHLLDVVDPDETFDAATFRARALAAVADVAGRGKLPVICGGTGLYVRVLLHGLFRGPAASPALRRELRAREEHEGAGTLHRELAREDPGAAARLHPRDLFRIVRALEVVRLTGRPISEWQREHAFAERPIAALVLGCTRPRAELDLRVEARCRTMLASGLLDEIRGLWRRGYGPELAPLQSVGYREMGAYLRGDMPFETAFEAFARATRRLAKRQRTWLRGAGEARWFHPYRDRAAILACARVWRAEQQVAMRQAVR